MFFDLLTANTEFLNLYFTTPGSRFFFFLICVHDECCFYLVLTLVFVYWMLCSVLNDHIYLIDNSIYRNKINGINFTFINKIKLVYTFWIFQFILLILKHLSSLYFYNYEKNLLKTNKIDLYTYFLTLVLSTLGVNFYKNFIKISKFMFFKANNKQHNSMYSELFDTLKNYNKLADNFNDSNNFDTNKKVLFSGCNSNLLSLEGKLLEMEEVYLLSQVSVDYNVFKLNSMLNNVYSDLSLNDNDSNYNIEAALIKSDSDESIIFKKGLYLLQKASYSTLNNKKDNYVLMHLYLDFINAQVDNNSKSYNPILYNLELSYFDLKNNYYSHDTFNTLYNKVFTRDYYFELVYFYKRRFNRISYFFNPYLEVFNDIFNINDKSRYSLSSNYEPSYYIWWEFNYIYMILRFAQSETISNDPYSIHYDVITDALNYIHSMSYEYIWALFPTQVISLIVGPSFLLLYTSSIVDEVPMGIVNVVAYQWYWSYELVNYTWFLTNYSTNNNEDSLSLDNIQKNRNIIFSSNLVDPLSITDIDSILKPQQKRLLQVDRRLVLIAHDSYMFCITSGDVLHSFAVPALGFKVDAVPGRLNTLSTQGAKAGLYYGQCSELCGYGHGFMPIVIEFISHNNI